jgi:glucuronate isomerase
METLPAEPWQDAEVASSFDTLRAGKGLAHDKAERFRSALLHQMAVMDHKRGWVQQFHLGALRNNNSRLRAKLGPDTGFDSVGDFELARPLQRFFDGLDRTDALAKTILYNLNPRDNELLATMIGNFQDGSIPGKMQFGSAWWFLDQKDGIEAQLRALSNMGLLARFVGMITDSRSFLSYSRHDFFRRILCNALGDDVRRGLIPDERALLSHLVRNVCFDNAKRYFGFALGTAAS